MRRHRTEYKSQLTATSRPSGSSDSATERPSAGALSYHITSHRQHDERALCQGRTTVMQCRIKQRVIYSTLRRRLAIFRRFSRYIFYHQTVVQRLSFRRCKDVAEIRRASPPQRDNFAKLGKLCSFVAIKLWKRHADDIT